MNGERHIVLFDGDCAYCDGWVRWITKHDRKNAFRFVPTASDEGRSLRARYGVPPGIDSIVLVMHGRAWLRSDAAWRILNGLPGHGLTALLLRLIPRPLRDRGYELIARNRHRLGGPAMPPL